MVVNIALKAYKPITASLRHTCLVNKSLCWQGRPVQALSSRIRKYFSGRNAVGQRIVYTKDGKLHKRIYRFLDFTYISFGATGYVHRIEYDPTRSSFISLIYFRHNISCYIPTTANAIVGMPVKSSFLGSVNRIGDLCLLKYTADGSLVHNLEKVPYSGSSYSKAAGSYTLLLKKYPYANRGLVRLKSGVYKLLSLDCHALLGKVSNIWVRAQSLGKAGRNRWLGKKPNVRGVAMNPIDHPHGGGQGKKSKKVSPRTFSGKMFKHKKTSRSKTDYTIYAYL